MIAIKGILNPKLRPARSLVVGFMGIIAFGAFLLTLPMCNNEGVFINPVDALFTATSAVCVTGLVVIDTGLFFNTLGHTVIICLIQLGGLGFMTGAVLIFFLMGKRITLRNRMEIKEAMNEDSLAGLVKLIKKAVMLAFCTEAIGAILLCLRFVPQYGSKGVWYSIFHSISAFCNAGFDLFGNFNSLMAYTTDVYVTLVISILIIVGGLGYIVVYELFSDKGLRSLSLHAKVVLTMTGSLLFTGTVVFLIAEWSNPNTIGSLDLSGKITASFFQSVTTRTAGFNSIDLSAITPATLLFSMLLMIVGASPASTGGGLKTTTTAVLGLALKRVITGREDCEFCQRRLSNELVRRTIAIAWLYLLGLAVASMLICLVEVHSGFSLTDIVFEVVSAAGTVGLSVGITKDLTVFSRIILIIVMFAGRLGPLSLVMAFSSSNSSSSIRFPEEKIMVG